jgi:CBS domain containing-hemolysin-like protein
MPIYSKNLDNVMGFIHCKDLIKFIYDDKIKFKISDITRKILYVPHSMKITNLLIKMRSSGVHIAIILDEYGGTDGIITIEDIIEEIVGDIKDEHDILEDNIYLTKKKISNDVFHFGGRVDIEEVEEMLEVKISENEDGDFETIGGFMFFILKKVPEISEYFKRGDLSFKVIDSDSKSIKLIEITKNK